MQEVNRKIKFILRGSDSFTGDSTFKVLPVFSSLVKTFLAELSRSIRKNKEAVQYPDLVSFAFFCRKAHIDSLECFYADILLNSLGRGICFHISPANVPTIFAYSLVAGLLSGNANIVRISEKESPQVRILLQQISGLLERKEFLLIKKYITIVTYGHDKACNDYFSSICDVRVIWGGDRTVAEIRKSPLSSNAYDVTFRDRYSLCLLNAHVYLKDTPLEKKMNLANLFYNDAYMFDQNACSSPKVVFWFGEREEVKLARKQFWDFISAVLRDKEYQVGPVEAVNKFHSMCHASLMLGGVSIEKVDNNLCNRAFVEEINSSITDCLSGGGLFYECQGTDFSVLQKIVCRKVQTMTYYGFDCAQLVKTIVDYGLVGIDRVVPVGDAMKFSFEWDGYDLIRNLSRKIASA